MIAGPTASGKSALALALAERLGALVVNADSMQVYRDLAVLTARPAAADLDRCPHRLYGHVDAAASYSVAQWLADVGTELADADRDRRRVVIVGGTGLYFRALLGGLSAVPEIPAEIRSAWRQSAAVTPSDALHAALAARDPAMAARLEPGDTQRIVRALEVVEATGRSLLEFQQTGGRALVAPDAPRIVLAPPRPWLHARIDQRFRQMVAQGAIEEAARLDARGLDPSLPAMKAIGLRELSQVARGHAELEAAIDAGVVATRRYAKRQETFFRGQLGDWPRLDPTDAQAVERWLNSVAS